MAEERIVWIAKMSLKDQEKCSGCPAVVKYAPPPSLCGIALAEKERGKKLRLWQIADMKIDMLKIPIDCPNKY